MNTERTRHTVRPKCVLRKSTSLKQSRYERKRRSKIQKKDTVKEEIVWMKENELHSYGSFYGSLTMPVALSVRYNICIQMASLCTWFVWSSPQNCHATYAYYTRRSFYRPIFLCNRLRWTFFFFVHCHCCCSLFVSRISFYHSLKCQLKNANWTCMWHFFSRSRSFAGVLFDFKLPRHLYAVKSSTVRNIICTKEYKKLFPH